MNEFPYNLSIVFCLWRRGAARKKHTPFSKVNVIQLLHININMQPFLSGLYFFYIREKFIVIWHNCFVYRFVQKNHALISKRLKVALKAACIRIRTALQRTMPLSIKELKGRTSLHWCPGCNWVMHGRIVKLFGKHILHTMTTCQALYIRSIASVFICNRTVWMDFKIIWYMNYHINTDVLRTKEPHPIVKVKVVLASSMYTRNPTCQVCNSLSHKRILKYSATEFCTSWLT